METVIFSNSTNSRIPLRSTAVHYETNFAEPPAQGVRGKCFFVLYRKHIIEKLSEIYSERFLTAPTAEGENFLSLHIETSQKLNREIVCRKLRIVAIDATAFRPSSVGLSKNFFLYLLAKNYEATASSLTVATPLSKTIIQLFSTHLCSRQQSAHQLGAGRRRAPWGFPSGRASRIHQSPYSEHEWHGKTNEQQPRSTVKSI